MEDTVSQVTRILQRCGAGGDAWGELFPIVHDELLAIARARMADERAGHTLQATALVSETYLRLVANRDIDWESRRHFYGAAGEAMRRVLIDHARRRRTEKRAGDRVRVSLSIDALEQEGTDEMALAMAEALETLQQHDPRAAEVVRLRFFAGLSVNDTAKAIGISERTVLRETTYARARLAQIARPRGG